MHSLPHRTLTALSCFHQSRKMMEQFDFLDPQNVAVWGWGPGASLALDAAALAPDLLKCVAAVNPVADWRAHGTLSVSCSYGNVCLCICLHVYR